MKHETEESESETDTPQALSDRTPIRLGLTLTIAGLCVGAIVGVTAYGAGKVSEFSTKLDNLTVMLQKATTQGDTLQNTVATHVGEDQKKWTEIESRLAIIERSGSDKTRELEKDISNLRRDFQVHEALSKAGVK